MNKFPEVFPEFLVHQNFYIPVGQKEDCFAKYFPQWQQEYYQMKEILLIWCNEVTKAYKHVVDALTTNSQQEFAKKLHFFIAQVKSETAKSQPHKNEKSTSYNAKTDLPLWKSLLFMMFNNQITIEQLLADHSLLTPLILESCMKIDKSSEKKSFSDWT